MAHFFLCLYSNKPNFYSCSPVFGVAVKYEIEDDRIVCTDQNFLALGVIQVCRKIFWRTDTYSKITDVDQMW